MCTFVIPHLFLLGGLDRLGELGKDHGGGGGEGRWRSLGGEKGCSIGKRAMFRG